MKKLILLLTLALLLAGCATTGPTVIPPGCEKSIAYQIPEFVPGGPIAIRVAASTAVAVATGAGHPEVRVVIKEAMPIAYKFVMAGNLPGAINAILAKLKVPQIQIYVQPVIVALDSLMQAGVIQGGAQLTECDKNIFGSLFKNIGLDAGCLLTDF